MENAQRRQVERALASPPRAGAGCEAVVPNPKLRLLDQMPEVLRLRHYSIRNETSFCAQPSPFLRPQSDSEWIPVSSSVTLQCNMIAKICASVLILLCLNLASAQTTNPVPPLILKGAKSTNAAALPPWMKPATNLVAQKPSRKSYHHQTNAVSTAVFHLTGTASGSTNLSIGKPNVTLSQPNTALGRPAGGVAGSSTALGKSSTGLAQPNTGLGRPGTGIGHPNVGIGQPATGPGQPNTGPGPQGKSIGEPIPQTSSLKTFHSHSYTNSHPSRPTPKNSP